uniref:Uncharacterized protein n=1 Tax=Romanomermis culicivorax TaxID=13658 RepID=A0A915IIV7_ROMCU
MHKNDQKIVYTKVQAEWSAFKASVLNNCDTCVGSILAIPANVRKMSFFAVAVSLFRDNFSLVRDSERRQRFLIERCCCCCSSSSLSDSSSVTCDSCSSGGGDADIAAELIDMER